MSAMHSTIGGMAVAAMLVTGCATIGGRGGARPRAIAPEDSRAGFEWRRLHGNGRYLTAAELQAADRRPLRDLLRARILGFQEPGDPLARTEALGLTCTADVYLDGLFAPGALDGVHPRDLAGVEYYDVGTAPVQYRRGGRACPVLLLWLNR